MRLNVLNAKNNLKSDKVDKENIDHGSGDSPPLVLSKILEKQGALTKSHDVSTSFLKELLPREIYDNLDFKKSQN